MDLYFLRGRSKRFNEIVMIPSDISARASKAASCLISRGVQRAHNILTQVGRELEHRVIFFLRELSRENNSTPSAMSSRS